MTDLFPGAFADNAVSANYAVSSSFESPGTWSELCDTGLSLMDRQQQHMANVQPNTWDAGRPPVQIHSSVPGTISNQQVGTLDSSTQAQPYSMRPAEPRSWQGHFPQTLSRSMSYPIGTNMSSQCSNSPFMPGRPTDLRRAVTSPNMCQAFPNLLAGDVDLNMNAEQQQQQSFVSSPMTNLSSPPPPEFQHSPVPVPAWQEMGMDGTCMPLSYPTYAPQNQMTAGMGIGTDMGMDMGVDLGMSMTMEMSMIALGMDRYGRPLRHNSFG